MDILSRKRNKIRPKIEKYLNNCEMQLPEVDNEKHKADLDSNSQISELLSSQKLSIFMGLLTIYTIFASDIDRAFCTAEASVYFSIIHTIAIGIFFAEIILTGYAKDNYIGRFYFWIDLMSTLTMFLEIIWIEDLLSSSGDVSVALSFAKVTKASRLSKIGAKSFKIMKLVRLIRLMKIIEKKDQNGLKKKASDLEEVEIVGQHQGKQIRSIYNQSESQKPCDKIQDEQVQVKRVLQDSVASSSQLRKRCTIRQKTKREVVFTVFDKRQKKQEQNSQQGILSGIKDCVILPPLERKRVDPEKQRQVQRRWLQIIEQQNQDKNRNKKKEQHNAEENTKVGQILKEQIQKNIVLMIVGLIIFVPIFAAETWFDLNMDVPNSTANVFRSIQDQSSDQAKEVILRELIQEGLANNLPLVHLTFPINRTCCVYPRDFPEYPTQEDLGSLRKSQIDQGSSQYGQITFSKRELVRLSAKLNLVRGLFITLLLIFASLVFMKNIEQYALDPLEKMTKTITHISENPFETIKQMKNEEEEEEEQQAGQELELQTKVLQGIVVKLINLMVIGAGQIGSSLITNSINKGSFDSSQMQNNTIVAVYFYVRIANLELISKILGQSLMLYINAIAAIVHANTVKYGGIPGECDPQGFLLIWTFDDQNIIRDNQKKNQKFGLKRSLAVRQTVDLVMFAFIEMSIALAKSTKLRKFQSLLAPQIQQFQSIKICGGIHIGSALQGAIGSNFKLQSKCLGEDILIAKTLSAMSEVYGVSNLISEDLYNIMSLKTREWTRKIDTITHFYPDKRLQIFTIDLFFKGIDQQEYPQIEIARMQHYVQVQFKERQKLRQRIQSEEIQIYMEDNEDFMFARQIFTTDFYDQWGDALEHYLSGDWQFAEPSFRVCTEVYSFYEDKPSSRFLKIIQKQEGYPPDGWDKVSALPCQWLK